MSKIEAVQQLIIFAKKALIIIISHKHLTTFQKALSSPFVKYLQKLEEITFTIKYVENENKTM